MGRHATVVLIGPQFLSFPLEPQDFRTTVLVHLAKLCNVRQTSPDAYLAALLLTALIEGMAISYLRIVRDRSGWQTGEDALHVAHKNGCCMRITKPVESRSHVR